jgi:hypothetical protein
MGLETMGPQLFIHGGKPLTGDKMGRLFTRACVAHGQVPLRVSDYRHLAIAFMRKHVAGADCQLEEEEREGTYDRQAGHSSRTAQKHYAVATTSMRQIKDIDEEGFFKASQAWHRFLFDDGGSVAVDDCCSEGGMRDGCTSRVGGDKGK